MVESCKHEDFAILFRMNAQSRLLEQNLRALKIPYRVIGGKSFFDRREIKDLLAYAQCLLNNGRRVSLLRIINTPARGISAGTVETRHRMEREESLQRLCRAAGAGISRGASQAHALQRHRRLSISSTAGRRA